MLRGTVGVLEELHFANSPAQQKSTAGDFYDETSFQAVTDQLNEYFAGRRQTFNVKLAPQGTDFQQQVWLQLSKIPYGQAVSYSHIAEQIGNPKANRAVGLANGKNPLPIIVPCHRVIGKDGSLTGFGGGLDVKRFLLNLEGYVI